MKTPIKHNITSYDPKDGVLVDASNSSIARVGRTNQAQNIAQIIRAVNYHEMLLEALKESADVLAKLMQTARIEGKSESENYARHGLATARTALAAAEGE